MDRATKRKIRKRVEAKKGFVIHAIVYGCMFLFFFIINMSTLHENPEVWFYLPMAPWGFGLAMHYFGAFGFPGMRKMVERWEEKETEKEYQRAGRQYRQPAALPPESDEDFLDLEGPRKKKEKQPEERKLYNEDDLV